MRILKILILLFGIPLFVSAQTNNTSKLTGIVYDAQGSVVVDARVMAKGPNGKVFEGITNAEGIYVLTLAYNKYEAGSTFKEARYDITVKAHAFKNSVTNGFVFIPSQFGAMHLDIALEVETIIDRIAVPKKKRRN